MRLEVKICGVSTPEAITAASAGGARFVGLVFFDRSPRAVTPALAAELARSAPTALRLVGLFVDAEDEDLERVVSQVPLDMLQLHGSETPERVAAVRRGLGMPVMKAIKVGDAADLDAAEAYQEVADRLLFDARPPANLGVLPGGTGLAFDWSLLAGRRWRRPWMLAGGLTVENLAEAVQISGAPAVDVSSGVEDRPGHKNVASIAAFLGEAAVL